MERLAILCIDDEREVLDAITRDLECFSSHFRIEPCESADDARMVIEDLTYDDIRVGIVLADHMMPRELGVDFLVSLNKTESGKLAKKILVTAQAGFQDTIRALNNANLDHFIAKPWTPEQLKEVVVRYLTEYVLQNCPEPLQYLAILDSEKILEHFSNSSGFSPS